MANRTEDSALYQHLVEVGNFDPELARPGDWFNLYDALVRLQRAANQQMGTAILPPGGTPPPLADIEAEVRPLHAELRHLLRTYAAGRAEFWPFDIQASVSVVGSEPPLLQVTGRLRDTAILMTVMLLARAARPPIALCPEDERLFLRVRRQQYCSRKCVNRANVRSYRAAMLEKVKKAMSKKRRTR